MFDYLIRFRAASVPQRRKAIMELGQSNDKRAITLLEQIAADEPDPSLKTLAEWAAQHLRSLPSTPDTPTTAAPETPKSNLPVTESPMSDLPGSSAAPAQPADKVVTSSGKSVPEAEQRRAKARLDHALSLHMSKQDSKALTVLAEAATADPSILDTPVVQNLAAALTGEAGDRALEIVREKSHDSAVIGQLARPEFKLTPSAELFDTILEMVGLFAVVVFIFVIIDIGAIRLFNRAVDAASSGLGQLNASDPHAVGTAVAEFGSFSAALGALNTNDSQATLAAASPPLATSFAHFINNPDMGTLAAQYPPTPADIFAQVSTALQQGTPTVAVPGAQATALAHVRAAVNQLAIPVPPVVSVLGDSLRFAIGFCVSLLLSVLVIYVIGSVIGGAGTLLKFTRYLTRTYLVLFGAILIGLVLLYVIVSRPDMPSSNQAILGGAALILIGLSGLIGFFVLAFAVGRGHQFSFLHGLVALLIGEIVFGLLIRVLGIGAALGT